MHRTLKVVSGADVGANDGNRAHVRLMVRNVTPETIEPGFFGPLVTVSRLNLQTNLTESVALKYAITYAWPIASNETAEAAGGLVQQSGTRWTEMSVVDHAALTAGGCVRPIGAKFGKKLRRNLSPEAWPVIV
jgi:hypothetical protein